MDFEPLIYERFGTSGPKLFTPPDFILLPGSKQIGARGALKNAYVATDQEFGCLKIN